MSEVLTTLQLRITQQAEAKLHSDLNAWLEKIDCDFIGEWQVTKSEGGVEWLRAHLRSKEYREDVVRRMLPEYERRETNRFFNSVMKYTEELRKSNHPTI